jgi:protoporphyrinogen oxidase
MVAFAMEELSKIGIIDASEVLDSTVLRMEKTYPAYFGTYYRFAEIREHVDRYKNLFLVGRNGMHRYNNQDHSMLTAMMAVDDIIAGKTDKNALWEVNTEMDYHEQKGKQA